MSSWNQVNMLTAGQSESQSSLAVFPNEGVGWTSEAPSRRSPKPRRSRVSQISAPYIPAKPARPSHKNVDPSHIPRPENSFILFRKHFVRSRSPNLSLPQGKTLSKVVGETWRGLSADVKLHWHRMANEASKEHARKHPNWKYCPVRQKIKAKKQMDTDRKIEENSVTFHSTESSPESNPAPASNLVTGYTDSVSSSLQAPFASVTTTIHPQLIQRKRCFRLSSWDDSVLHSQVPSGPFQETFPNERQEAPSFPAPMNWTWEALRRRSSSAPLPVSPGLDGYLGTDSVYQNMERMFDPTTPAPDNTQVQSNLHPETNVENNDPITTPISLSDVHHPTVLSWSDGVCLPSSIATPFMFFSPIQQLPSLSHLDVEENDRQFSQLWSESSFCSSPEPIFSTSSSTSSCHNTDFMGPQAVNTHFGPINNPLESKNLFPEILPVEEPKAEQITPSIPRLVQEKHSQSLGRRERSFHPYACTPRKTTSSSRKEKQAVILVEDLLKLGPSGVLDGSDELGHLHISDFEDLFGSSNTLTLLSAAPMDPFFDFYSTP